jgi:hypothetical protein
MAMRTVVAALVATAAVAGAGCKDGRLTAKAGSDSTKTVEDTVVTRRQVQDTMVVRTDTSVKVDTSIKRGGTAPGTRRDTVADTRSGKRAGAGAMRDSAMRDTTTRTAPR